MCRAKEAPIDAAVADVVAAAVNNERSPRLETLTHP
jgi:hypothetical protein